MTKFYGDYSTVIHFFLFVIPFIIVLIIINLVVLYKFESKRNNTQIFRKTLSILLLLCGLNLLIGFIDSKKSIIMILNQENELRPSKLYLYKNSTYKITTLYPHGTSNYSGKYRLENNILELYDTNIEKKTNDRFTNSYKRNEKSNQFEPTKNNFNKLEIEN
ncbi:MAG: hypothetical protein C4K58_07085 [Flavobacteriaceae bacterium]|nr:MAG: hypothetical protein C4K58_07085 [Flavobacteriaceae bacterium]